MKKVKNLFVCQECGYLSSRWLGKCPGCGAWNSMVEEVEVKGLARVLEKKHHPKPLFRWEGEESFRLSTGFSGLDQALGGGLVKGQVILLAGEPGIGKSTLLLQVCEEFSRIYGPVLYISGEESPSQIAVRAKRLGVGSESLLVFPETNLETIIETLGEEKPSLLVVDSVQTLYSSNLESSPGSVAQVRECAFRLSEACKLLNIPLFLV
ncbi:MAG: ATP-binding cassette domain-containing protein, partial [Aquificota bacterium]